ncbi:MAG: trypsin-like peptidase domain-containing protein [Thermodesulfobacteriota bacterium]
MKRIFPVIIALFWAICIPGASSPGGKLYRWVDEKGVIHFSDRAPDSSDKVRGVLEEREIKDAPPPGGQKPPEIRRTARSPIEHAVNCTFTIKGQDRMGTGFLVTANGFAATCRHVMEGVSQPMAVLNDRREVPIQLVAMSHRHDLALVQVLVPERVSHLSLGDAEAMIPGDRLFAVGTSAGLQATVTDGVFTGLRKVVQTDETLVQFSAPINPGNSGGPLLDEKGRVLGVVSLKYLARDGLPVSGVGFAVPSKYLIEEFGSFIR